MGTEVVVEDDAGSEAAEEVIEDAVEAAEEIIEEAVEGAVEIVEAAAEAAEEGSEGSGGHDPIELESRIKDIENTLSEVVTREHITYDDIYRIAEEKAREIAAPVAAVVAEEVAEDVVEEGNDDGDDEGITVVEPDVTPADNRRSRFHPLGWW